jgi:O-antigen ligase
VAVLTEYFPLYVIAQIFGAGAMASLFFLYQQSSRKRLLAGKLSADICWVVHYFLMGGYGGMITNGVAIFRELTFMHRDKYKFLKTVATPIVFIAINFSLGLLTFSSPINILPIVTSAFVTTSLWLREPKFTKLVSIPVSVSFFVYDLVIGSWIGMINESIAICSIIISFVKERKKTSNESK